MNSDLLERARRGDEQAFGELYAANVDAARAFARSVTADPADAEDLVSEAFTRAFAQLRVGRGPVSNLLPYLLTAIRNRNVDRHRQVGRESPASDRPWVFDEAAEPEDLSSDDVAAEAAVEAFASLPDRWKQVLWQIEVEGRPVAEVANALDIRPATVSSLIYRAREGLKLAYLDRHLGATPRDRNCQWVRARLSQHVRSGLSARAASRIEEHLDGCSDCSMAAATLGHTNKKLAVLILPVVLLGGTTALHSSGTLTGAASGGGAGVPDASGGGPSGGGSAVTGPFQAAQGVIAGLSAPAAAAAVVAAALVVAAVVVTWPDRDPSPSATPTPSPSARWSPTPDAVGVEDPEDPSATPATLRAGLLNLVPSEATTSTSGATAPLGAVVAVPTASPVASPIASCGQYGRLSMPATTGVVYRLTEGDGRSGPWTVTASPRPGYAIAGGAATVFRGDLGTYIVCPDLARVARTSVGGVSWELTTDVSATDTATYLVEVDVHFADVVYTNNAGGTGWACWATDGTTRHSLDGTGDYELQPGAQWVVCEQAYSGTDPDPVSVQFDTFAAAPGGVVRARRDGTTTATKPF